MKLIGWLFPVLFLVACSVSAPALTVNIVATSVIVNAVANTPTAQAPTQASAPQPTLSFVTVTAVQALNLRAAAGVHAHILDQLPSGTSLVVVGNCQYQGGWWVKVMAGKMAGWVSQAYISAEVCQ
jgi:uncharacterized protein YraI